MKPELVTVSNVRWFIPAIKVWQVSMVPLTPSDILQQYNVKVGIM